MTSDSNDLDKLSWLPRLNRVIDEDIAAGKAGSSTSYVVAALIRALHEKGILSSQERDDVFAAWDRLNAFQREASEKEMKALREHYSELDAAILGSTSDPP
jgi:hypothetical protein